METILVKHYTGNEETAFKAFQEDVPQMLFEGYSPINQQKISTPLGCGLCILIYFLFFFFLTWIKLNSGISWGFAEFILSYIFLTSLIILYNSLTKNRGGLMVTYEYRPKKKEKTCSKCAETVKLDAKLCRYCGYFFT
ncbi:zinc ribbon domain-containing protein [Flectobacillus longus]|uniref:zinc ribbon domain-containing protein n=1 Tax=Flectobacillus longus TaxID=2984207 RepID=UPI0024B77F87|nr:zinc ribbon domain-containing protein [Flectobacillus longus]MDI9878056.1 hypothetical protein [Flectobacillus longus]